MKRANFKRSKETRQDNAKARKYTDKHPETEYGFCQNCKGAPSPIRHGLKCNEKNSPFEGQFVQRKNSCPFFHN
jgi:hypothetical protein